MYNLTTGQTTIYGAAGWAGHTMGAQSGSALFLRYGYRASTLFSIALLLTTLLLFLIRGPNVDRKTWSGWQGGWSLRKRPEERLVLQPEEEEEVSEKGELHSGANSCQN
jgi:hypothetical protein